MDNTYLVEAARSTMTGLIEDKTSSEVLVDSDDSTETILADRVTRQLSDAEDETKGIRRPRHEILGNLLVACDESDGSRIHVPSCVMKHAELVKLSRQAPWQPIICRASLRELEASAMQVNINLRIDICYDPEVSFQPVSGLKGVFKAKKSAMYWECIAVELQTYQHDLQGGCEECNWMQNVRTETISSRLYNMIAEMRNLVLMQIPALDKRTVEESIDIAWMIRLIRLGIFDMARFSTWLSNLLLTYCAPMRDDTIRAVHERIVQAAAIADMTEVTQALDTLSRLLEMMKLDIGNHYLRTVRDSFIQGAIPFLQDRFGQMAKHGQLDVLAVKTWFEEQVGLYCFTRIDGDIGHVKRQLSRFECFVLSLVQLCQSTCGAIPLVLQYDIDRFRVLRGDLQMLADLDVCVRVCNEHLRHGRKLSNQQARNIKNRMLQLITIDGVYKGLQQHKDDVAVEIVKMAHSILSKDKRRGTTINIEDELQQVRNKLSSEDYMGQAKSEIMQQLKRQVLLDAAAFTPHTPLEISSMQTRWATNRVRAAAVEGYPIIDLEAVSRRLAHIAVIVWRIWADIVFDAEDIQ